MDWKNLLEGGIRAHLNAQLKEVMKHKDAYSDAKNPINAQLWVAIAGLSKQIFDLNLRLNYLERALKDINNKKNEEFVEKLGRLELELSNLLQDSDSSSKNKKIKSNSGKG